MGFRDWFKLLPSAEEILARRLCNKLMYLDKKVREESYYKICNDPHFDEGVIKALIKNHRDHIIYKKDPEVYNG